MASNKASWKIGINIAKKITSNIADSNNTKITDTSQANQAGQLALIKAWDCKGNRNTNDNTNEIIPNMSVNRKGHKVLSHN